MQHPQEILQNKWFPGCCCLTAHFLAAYNGNAQFESLNVLKLHDSTFKMKRLHLQIVNSVIYTVNYVIPAVTLDSVFKFSG